MLSRHETDRAIAAVAVGTDLRRQGRGTVDRPPRVAELALADADDGASNR